MGDVWFTSDEHYNHAKIISLMKRPFSSVEEMNEVILERHNRVVRPGDRVYHLGDFAWYNGHEFLDRLNGSHYLIKGNHDYRSTYDDYSGFIWVKDVKQLTVGKDTLWLSHYAHMVWPRSHYGSYHLYGHSHGMLPHTGKAMDVGVDAHDFYPVNIDSVIESLRDRQISNHHPIELEEIKLRLELESKDNRETSSKQK